jgi:hypothetical protein
VEIEGTGFNDPRVNLYTFAGNVGPLVPLAGGTSSRIGVTIPNDAPTGQGSIEVANAPYTGNVRSNAVSVGVGPRIGISMIIQSGTTVTVYGSGFSPLTLINFFNQQGGHRVVNLGGINADGSPRIPVEFITENDFRFEVPAGAVDGPAFIEALNPPFIPGSTSGNDPEGAFPLDAP